MTKKLFLIFLTTFILSFSLNAQTKNSISISSINGFKFYQMESYTRAFNTIQTDNTFIDFNINIDYIKKPFFQKYNSISSLNDVYVDNNDGTFTYMKSSLYIGNLYRDVKIDSYNPRGMTPNGTSIIFGVLGVFLDKLQH
jgi:hypothetical protein